MIKEFNKNIVKCHNCSTLWTFSNEDVQEIEQNDGLLGSWKEYFIKCPKCNNYLELYNYKGVW